MAEPTDFAIQTFEKKLNQQPQSLIFSRLADCYRKRGDIQQAIDVCSQGLTHHPDSITGRVILGRCYLEQEKFKEALLEFTKVIEQDSRNQVALKMLADMYARQDMKEKAGDIYAYLLAMDPENQSIANATTLYHGTGATSIYRILGFETSPPEPEQPLSVTENASSSRDDIFAGNEEPGPAAAESQNSMEAFAQTMRFDSEALKNEMTAETPAEETMKMVSEEDSPSPHSQAMGVEELDHDITESIDASVTGDDISARMSKMFEDESPAALSLGEQDILSSDPIHDALPPQDAIAPSEPMQTESVTITEPMAEVSGSDISHRIDQLFGETPKEEISAGMMPEPIEQYPAASEPVEPGRSEDSQQDDVLGADIVSRMSEMFENADKSAPSPSDVPEVISQIPDDVNEEIPLSNVLDKLLEHEELHGASVAASAGETEKTHEDAVSGDDIARRLETIFEEEPESAAPEVLTPLSEAGSFENDIDISPLSVESELVEYAEDEKTENEPANPADEVIDLQIPEESNAAAAQSLVFDDSPELPEPAISEATVIREIQDEGDGHSLTAQSLEINVPENDTDHEAEAVSPAVGPALDYVDESVGEAQMESGPEMSGDDVRSRLDEMFPEPLGAEETLVVSDEVLENEKVDGNPNDGFYTMSGENASLPSAQDPLLAKLDEVSYEAPDAPIAFPADPEAESDLLAQSEIQSESADSIDFVPPEPLTVTPSKPGSAEKPDALASIPDHVLTPTLADIYFQQGQPHLAVEIYQRLLKKDPDNEKIIFRLKKIKEFIAENPQALPVVIPENRQKPERKAAEKSPAPPKAKTVSKKVRAAAKPLSGVRIKNKKKEIGKPL